MWADTKNLLLEGKGRCLERPNISYSDISSFWFSYRIESRIWKVWAVQAVRADMKENGETGERMRFCLRNSRENWKVIRYLKKGNKKNTAQLWDIKKELFHTCLLFAGWPQHSHRDDQQTGWRGEMNEWLGSCYWWWWCMSLVVMVVFGMGWLWKEQGADAPDNLLLCRCEVWRRSSGTALSNSNTLLRRPEAWLRIRCSSTCCCDSEKDQG